LIGFGISRYNICCFCALPASHWSLPIKHTHNRRTRHYRISKGFQGLNGIPQPRVPTIGNHELLELIIEFAFGLQKTDENLFISPFSHNGA
jgi:hypothetical protein